MSELIKRAAIAKKRIMTISQIDLTVDKVNAAVDFYNEYRQDSNGVLTDAISSALISELYSNMKMIKKQVDKIRKEYFDELTALSAIRKSITESEDKGQTTLEI